MLNADFPAQLLGVNFVEKLGVSYIKLEQFIEEKEKERTRRVECAKS